MGLFPTFKEIEEAEEKEKLMQALRNQARACSECGKFVDKGGGICQKCNKVFCDKHFKNHKCKGGLSFAESLGAGFIGAVNVLRGTKRVLSG